MMLAIVHDIARHWWLYASMPFIGGLVGYFTKVVAIEMMYRPIEYRGVLKPYLGWQGMIPRRAAKMAAVAVDMFVGRLIRVEEIFDRIEPEALARELEEPLREAIEELTEEIISQHQPGLWETMPDVAKRALIRRLNSQAPKAIASITAQVRDNLDQVFDLKHMVVTNLVRDKALLNRIFRDAAGPGMRFIIKSGAVFGFCIGLLQMLTFVLTGAHWVLPLYGLFTGSFTDWVALQMCFRPKDPTRYLGLFRWQGTFHAEREYISEQYGGMLARDILT
ncbi:MAG: DUF445 domain-containing protein, partial [Thermoplasmata archaeon]